MRLCVEPLWNSGNALENERYWRTKAEGGDARRRRSVLG